MLRNIEELHGFTIGALDGDVGAVTDCYFDDISYTVRYVVVDTGRWLSERNMILSPMAFRAMDWEHRRIVAALTKAQVEESPDIDTQKPVSRQDETLLFDHYGYSPYWTGSYRWGTSPDPYPAPGPDRGAADRDRQRRWNWQAMDLKDPHLQSARAMTGCHIQATDGDIGHVRDLLMDERSWAICFMLVDTMNWYAGEQVLVAPDWIDRVDWDHSKVQVTVTRAEIRSCPPYDPFRPVDRTHPGDEPRETTVRGAAGR